MANAAERAALREVSQDGAVTAGDVMRPALTAVAPGDHLAAAAYLMRHAAETALIVVDDERARRPVGLITEADIVHALADGEDLNVIRIRTLVTMRPTVVRTATTVSDAARAMVGGHFRHLPVVDDHDHLLGIVDILDICAALIRTQAADRSSPTPGCGPQERHHAPETVARLLG